MSEPIVRAVEHVSIVVGDAGAAALTFAALGFEPQWVEDLPGQGLRSHVLRAGDVVLELIETAPAAPAAGSADRFLARRGEGVHHLCLRVDSLEQAARAVEAAGMRLVDPVPTVDLQGRRVFVHPDSTHGILLGLVEPHQQQDPPAPAAVPAAARARALSLAAARLVVGSADTAPWAMRAASSSAPTSPPPPGSWSGNYWVGES